MQPFPGELAEVGHHDLESGVVMEPPKFTSICRMVQAFMASLVTTTSSLQATTGCRADLPNHVVPYLVPYV